MDRNAVRDRRQPGWLVLHGIRGGEPRLFYAVPFTMFETYDYDFTARRWVYQPD